MNYIRAAILAALILAAPAKGAIRIELAENDSGSSCGAVLTTNYRDGSCPQSGASCSALTCGTKGDATATFDEDDVTSSTIDMTAAGSDDNGNFGYAYKNFTSGDIQATGCFPATSAWSGNLENFAGPGVGIAETTGDASWFFQCWIPHVGTIRQKYGTPPDSWVGESGPAVDAPVCLRALYVSSTTTLSCAYASTVGGTWTQFATPQVRTMPSTAIGYSFLTSHEVTASTSLQATDVTVVNTSGGDPDPPPPSGGSCASPFASPTNDIYNSGLNAVADTGCRNDDDIVQGFDWSFAEETSVVEQSGLWFQDGAPASYFTGNQIYQCNLRWKDIETSDDVYDWSDVNDCLTIAGSAPYNGMIVNMRMSVRSIDDCNGNDRDLNLWTAPAWMQFGTDVTESCKNNLFRITNIDMDNASVRAEMVEFINAFVAQNFHTDPDFKFLIIKGASSSRGEECCVQMPGAQTTYEALINAWTSGFGSQYAHKLGWLKENPADLFVLAVDTGGAGVRGGILERWLRTQYTPGNSDFTGQILTAQGHLTIDPTFLTISENRHWGDQIEEFGRKDFTTNIPQNYRMASLRAHQMRRNNFWTDGDIDQRLDAWGGVIVGKNASTSHEAWTALFRSWARTGNSNVEINNFERWMGQREALGSTTPTLNINHGYNATGNANLPSSLWNIDRARTGTHIGLFVDDQFWPTNLTHNCIVKVTYRDVGTGTFSIVHDAETTVVNLDNTNELRTATAFTDSCTMNASGEGEDIALTDSSGAVPFFFIRLIKRDGTFPAW